MVAEFSAIVLLYRFLGKTGLFLWIIVATIAQNIEVLILVDAFGMEMTLGNVLFASTFLVTDILSELYGKEESLRAVRIGIATAMIFIIISLTWLLYTPSQNDFASESIRTIFSNTPRILLASIAVYIVVQITDVMLYHKWWDFTTKKYGDRDKYLWFRNNGSTLISQLVNTVLFNVLAFAGTYDFKTLVSIIISGYVIFVVTSLCDTPFVYAARWISKNRQVVER